MHMKIKAYHAVAEWKWDLPDDHDDTCGICRVQFEGTCSKCRYPGDDCPIMIGECTHTFHMHCISDWLQSDASQGRCPMCRQVFREKTAAPKTPTNQQSRPTTGTSTSQSRSRPQTRPQTAGSGRSR